MQLDRLLGYFNRVRPASPHATRVRFIVVSSPSEAMLLNVVSVEFDVDDNLWMIKFKPGLALTIGGEEAAQAALRAFEGKSLWARGQRKRKVKPDD